MSKQKELTFKSLPEKVQEALLLLKKVKSKAIGGMGHHYYDNCPIAKGFDVFASFSWSTLEPGDVIKLKEAGWNSRLYGNFIHWYDGGDTDRKEKFLRIYLR